MLLGDLLLQFCDMIFARWRKPWRLTSLCQIKKISWFPLEFFKVRWCCGIGFIFPSCCTERKVCLIAVDVLSGDEYLSSHTHFSFVSTFLRVILPPWRVPPRRDIPLLRMWRGAGLQEGDFSSEIAALWARQDCNQEQRDNCIAQQVHPVAMTIASTRYI